ncbi:hypothetical protein Agub_g8975 [Astrephomene gubernaculifera]|uniref:Protein kinase domain-containing protein n=1 Tax=Astrephomene gubernaculifera TaxID=47775 RepID=A0AAD3DVB1_9CHLO|nr:hypothetical protein Agub_g8975 [Astrephomene gubernaculifera]
MTAGAGGGAAEGNAAAGGMFSRDSLSSHWLVSPSTSNHQPNIAGGGGLYGSRSTGGGGLFGDNSMYGTFQLGAAVFPCSPSTSAAAPTAPSPPMPAVATSPVSVPGASCRGRATLARAGSRLQVATTSIRQPSIPEDMQALGIADYYLPVCVAPAQPPLAALQAPAPPAATVATNDEARRLMYGIPACGDAGATCRSCAPGATALAAATAAAAAVAPTAVAESVGGACTHSGGASAGIESPFALVAGILPPPSPCSPCSPLSPQRCGSFSKAPRGLLAAAIAAHANPHTSHCPHPASPGPFGSGARAMPAYAGVNVASSAAAITLHERPASASVSAAFSRMTFSSKRLSGVTFGPNFAHCSAPTPCDAVPNSSANVGGGASAATARSMPPPGVIVGGPGAGSGSASVAATGSGSGGRAAPSAAASTIAAMEAEAVKQDALERGWKTLQEIMQRLNARPGDFLTRIVMEDADQGSLLSAVRNGCFQSGAPDSQLRTVLLTALDIARGMAFLHKSNVIHGDLKPSNVLLCSDAADPRGFVAKVSDFGLSRIIARGQDSLRNPEPFPAGTVSYMAPETVSGCSCKASDVWSYAVLVWQLLTGELAPWPGLRNVQIMMGVLQGDLRLSMPQGAYPPLARLIESCLTHDFQQRPSFDDIVAKLQEMLHNLAHAPAAQPTPAAATALQNHHEPRETGPASTTTTTTTIASVVLVNTAAAATATPSGSPAIASLRPTRGGAGAAHVDRNNDLASEGDPPDRPMGQSPFATVTTMLAPTPSPAPASAAVPIAVDTAAYVLPLPVASEAPTVNLLDAPIAAAVAASFRTRCPPTGSVEPRSTTSKPALTVNACTAVFPRAPSAAAAAASAPASTADMQDQHQQQRQRQRIANPTVPTTCRSPTNPFMEASCLRAFDRNLLLSGVAAMPQSSLTGTDASLTTAAASSNQLSNVSSSWANTTEREHRGGGWNHAWHSSAWQLPTVPASGAGSGIGGGGSSHIYSRPSMTASMGVSLGGAGVMQEFLYRQRISAGSVPTDMSTLVSDCHLSRAPRSPFAVPEPPPCCPVAVGGGGYSGGCASNICCYNGGHANNDDGNPGTAANCSNADGVVDVGGHARARAPLGAPDSHMRAATCPSTLAIVGSTLSSALMTCGGGSDMSHMILPIVHEEPFHVTTTSSGYQTAMTHGSPTQTLSGSRHVLTGNAGDRRHPESFLLTGSGYDNRRQHESSVLGSSPRIGSGGGGASCGGGGSFGGGGGSTIGSSVGEAALPVMLQAGLIVLGAREITAGRSSKSICSRSVSQALRAGAAGTGSEGLSHLEDGSQGQRGREEFSPAANSRSSTGTGIALMMPSGGFAESRRSCRSLVSGPLGCQEGGHSGALSGALVLRKSCSLGRGGRS